MNYKTLYIVFLFVSSLTLIQCKAKKPLIEIEEDRIYHFSRNQADTIVKNVLANNFEFIDLKAKIKTKFKSRERKNLSFGTFIKMKKDSSIHATISFAAIPVLVAYITPDSLKFLNKKDQKYFVGDYSYVSKLLNTDISFAQIQNLLVGNPITLDSNRNNYFIEEENDIFISSLNPSQIKARKESRNPSSEWFIKYWVNELYKTGKTVMENDSSDTKIEVFQADYNKVSGQNFPNRTRAEIITPKDSISLILNYQRVKINTDLEYSFSIPDHYTPYE